MANTFTDDLREPSIELAVQWHDLKQAGRLESVSWGAANFGLMMVKTIKKVLMRVAQQLGLLSLLQ